MHLKLRTKKPISCYPASHAEEQCKYDASALAAITRKCSVEDMFVCVSVAVIARMLPGRTNAAVKNFFYSYRRRVGKTLR